MTDSRDPTNIRMARPPARRGRLRLRNVLILLLLAALAFVAWERWGRPHAKPPAAGQSASGASRTPGGGGRFTANGPQPVGVATVTTGDIDITLNALGTVTPLATVTVQTQINGQLTEIGFTEGRVVKKGDFLAQIDPRPYEVALDQAQAQLVRDQALLKGAQVDLARYQKLAAQNSIAQQQADDQLYLVGQYQGTVQLDEASVASAKLNLVYCHIIAPVSGRAGLRQVDVGNYVQTAAGTGIVVITELQPITVIFPVAEDFLPQIMKRLGTGAKLSVTLYDRSNTNKLATGTLTAVDSQIDPTTGTVKLKAEFDNDDLALFPQQFVNAQLLIDTLKNVVVAPTASIQRGTSDAFVYLVKGDKVAVTTVKLGPVSGEKVAVLSGLSAGDQVVVDGADRLRDGAAITIPQAGGRVGGQRNRAASGAGSSGSDQSGAAAGGLPSPDLGTNAGTNSPVKGKTPDTEGTSGGPGYNPPPDQTTPPPNPAGRGNGSGGGQ
jgi:membrane fusion protein, multidrug efflux system